MGKQSQMRDFKMFKDMGDVGGPLAKQPSQSAAKPAQARRWRIPRIGKLTIGVLSEIVFGVVALVGARYLPEPAAAKSQAQQPQALQPAKPRPSHADRSQGA